jgi:hypothetical protein
LTFKDLKKRVTLDLAQQQSMLFEILQNKPFWIWNTEQHKLEDIRTSGDCCFNHILGLPNKEGQDKPLYDYQKIIFDSLVYGRDVGMHARSAIGVQALPVNLPVIVDAVVEITV